MVEPTALGARAAVPRRGMREVLRDRVLDATVELVVTDGWAAVTLDRVAGRVGMRPADLRAVVGPGLDTEADLGRAVVVRETERFVEGISQRLREHSTAVSAATAAASYALTTARHNRLVGAVSVGASGRDGDLSPLLAEQFDTVLRRTCEALVDVVRQQRYPDAAGRDVEAVVDALVRLTLDHLVHRTLPVEDAVAQVRGRVEELLGVRPGRP